MIISFSAILTFIPYHILQKKKKWPKMFLLFSKTLLYFLLNYTLFATLEENVSCLKYFKILGASIAYMTCPSVPKICEAMLKACCI